MIDEGDVSDSDDLAVRGPDVVEVWGTDGVVEPVPDPMVIDGWAIDMPIVPPRSDMAQWFVDCWWGLRLWFRKGTIHTLRSWLYAARAAGYSPAGLWKAFIWWQWWVRDVETLALVREVAMSSSIDADRKATKSSALRAERVHRIWFRCFLTLLVLSPYIGLAAWSRGAWWSQVLIVVGTVVSLGMIGAERGQIAPPVETPAATALTEQVLVDAFFYAKITKDVPVTVIGVPRQVTNGWYAELQLPPGLKVSKVIAEQESVASGMPGVIEECLEIDPLPKKAAGRFGLFIADIHPEDMVTPEWPPLSADRVSVFRPMPCGWDLRGRPILAQTMWVHTLIGALPRLGKTTLMRLFCLYALLDPRADLAVVDFGGGADFTPFRPHSIVFIHGEGDEEIAEFAQLLGWLRTEYRRRQAALAHIAETDPERCPEGRITEELAHLNQFRPIFVAVDEFQVATMAGKLGEAIVTEWAGLLKVCAKVGITFFAATQAADDSVPTELRNVMGQRLALTVASIEASIALLGNSAHRMGLNASTLGGTPGYGIEFGPLHKGKVLFANVTPMDARAVLARIERAAPQVRATAVDDTARPSAGIVTDALEVWPKQSSNCHLDILAARLAADVQQVRDRLSTAGVEAAQVRMVRPDGASTVRLGIRRADLEAAARRSQ